MRPAFHSVTLGCKLNRFDTAALEGALAARGWVAADDPRDAAIVIVNTCTVTHRADAAARKAIRRIRRENPGCKLWVTGCCAERDPRALRAIDGVDRVFGNRAKPDFAAWLDGTESDEAAPAAGGDRGCDGAALPALHFGRRTRAYLRVQDGCRLACSYCIIPEVRGGSRSVPADAVLRAAAHLRARGFREIVLTGVNTGDWGRDLEPRADLPSLLDALVERLAARHGDDFRVRLNSLEPRTVTDAVIDRLAAEPRLAPHLQVPLQSGSDAILAAMRRNYRTDLYRERVERLRARVPHAGIGADVIVGFPGETDARFRETLEFVESSPLTYLHVFSWSPRPGTPAAELPGRVPAAAIRERNRALRELAERKTRAFRRRLAGRTERAIVLEPDGGPEAPLRALTGNFLEVRLPAGRAAPGDLVPVVLGAGG